MKGNDIMSNLEKAKNIWNECIDTIFEKGNTPYTFIWKDKEEIADVLNMVGKMTDKYNYMFLPASGGMELEGCVSMCDYIDLKAGSTYSVKPYRLIFKYFEENPLQSYFRLEGVATFYGEDKNIKKALEPVVDFSEEERVYRKFGEYGDDMYSLHDCSFVIFNKYSNYNKDQSTDNGKHDRMTAEAFEEHILKNYL